MFFPRFRLDKAGKPGYDTPIETVEEEEYPPMARGKGSRRQCDSGPRQGGEWTSEGGGESFSCSCRREPTPVIPVVRMLVRKNECPLWREI